MPSNKMGVYYQTKIQLDFSLLVSCEETSLRTESRSLWAQEHEKIKKVVVEELSTKYLDWKNVTEDELSIKDVSGYGGNSTYCIYRSTTSSKRYRVIKGT